MDSTKFIHQAWLSQQRKAVLLNIGLIEFEKSFFWPVYESYCQAKEYEELEYLNIMLVYSNYLNTSNQTEAQRLYRLLLYNDRELAKLRLKYYKQICRALPDSKANAFMQLDESFRTSIGLCIGPCDDFNVKVQSTAPLRISDPSRTRICHDAARECKT